ncbi:MAG: hypothetical protein J0H31_19265, partial [Alphaproteobacteria bacterium]|nr:hypothetical protein [Alphaproteobacteria bacterium]
MTDAGWIVAAVLAVILLSALLLRTRLLAAFGYALRPIEPPQRSERGGKDQDGDDPRRDGEAAREERNRLEGLFDLEELEVSDVMVHRTNMRSVNADNAPEAVVREILTSPHTRMPLWKGSLDN